MSFQSEFEKLTNIHGHNFIFIDNYDCGWILKQDFGQFKCEKCGLEAYKGLDGICNIYWVYRVHPQLGSSDNLSCDEFIIKDILE